MVVLRDFNFSSVSIYECNAFQHRNVDTELAKKKFIHFISQGSRVLVDRL